MHQYFCRGCGKPLPPDRSRQQFHPECLKADKARRTREKRERRKQDVGTRVSQFRCPHCGEHYSAAKQHGDVVQEAACEASQPGSDAPISQG
jgi:predicted SprT family Zn-dependent metalloprotease